MFEEDKNVKYRVWEIEERLKLSIRYRPLKKPFLLMLFKIARMRVPPILSCEADFSV